MELQSANKCEAMAVHSANLILICTAEAVTPRLVLLMHINRCVTRFIRDCTGIQSNAAAITTANVGPSDNKHINTDLLSKSCTYVITAF